MNKTAFKKLSYFPGCSLVTSAKENNKSLIGFCRRIGIELVELEDWNCCGSSSAHSIDPELAFDLAARNLSLAPSDRPLVISCPGCFLRLKHAHHQLLNSQNKADHYNKIMGKPFNPQLKIIHFFELLDSINLPDAIDIPQNRLKGLKFTPYYGCMLARPPEMRRQKNYYNLMERILSSLGAKPLNWTYSSQCCGSFLSAVKPGLVTPMVNRIIKGAQDVGAECIVTACAMCHLNLEVRATLKSEIPIFHFSEILSLASGALDYKGWFARHIVDPGPALRKRELI